MPCHPGYHPNPVSGPRQSFTNFPPSFFLSGPGFLFRPSDIRCAHLTRANPVFHPLPRHMARLPRRTLPHRGQVTSYLQPHRPRHSDRHGVADKAPRFCLVLRPFTAVLELLQSRRFANRQRGDTSINEVQSPRTPRAFS